MANKYKDGYLTANGITQHYIEYIADKPKIFLLHGLTANAHAFDGIAADDLHKHFHLISPDLRGRGLSDHPAFCYTMNEHALDIIALLDHFEIEKGVIAGHSFGGLLAYYMAANYPYRIDRIISIDAAAQMNPRAGEMLSYALLRLDKVFPSFPQYLEAVKLAPYNTFWDDAMYSYYRADVKDLPDGSVTTRSTLANIIEIATNVANEPWAAYIDNILQPVLLLNATGEYTMGEPLLPEEKARETVARIPHATYVAVDWNHQTMMYGAGARRIAQAIAAFCTP